MRPLVLLLVSGCSSLTQSVTLGDVEVLTVRRSYANVHLVRAGAGMVLVDAGLERDAEAYDAALSTVVDLSELDAVIVGHGHSDHAGGANWFARTYDVPVVAGVGDEDAIDLGQNTQGLCATSPLAERRLEMESEQRWEPTQVTHWVRDEMPLSTFADMPGRIVRLPGHTEGSLIVEVGDAVLVSDLVRGSIGGRAAAIHFYMCDLDDNKADMRTLLDDLTPSAETFFTGHFGPVTRDSIEALLQD